VGPKVNRDDRQGLTHRDVLEFATLDGARACALDHKIGTLKPGKQAEEIWFARIR